jgi:hypothetical protein
MSSEESSIWQALQRLERQILSRGRPPGQALYDPRRSVDWFDELQARFDRVRRVRTALDLSGPLAHRLIAERLAGIELGVIADVLVAACKDVALYCGGSVLLGTAAGASLGAFAAGVGAVPGAAAGAMVGAQAGMWVLGLLGLKSLIEDLGTAIPSALRHYQQGILLAWGTTQVAQPPMDAARAPHEIAQGHVILIAAMLTALVAYLTRGRGRGVEGRMQVLREIQESRRLGPKVADWVLRNEQKLLAHPHLKPTNQRVTASGEAAAPPVTPSQLRAQRQHASESAAATQHKLHGTQAPAPTATSRPIPQTVPPSPQMAPGPARFMAPADRFYAFASRRSDVDPDGWFDVVAHGTSQQVEVMTSKGPALVDHRVAARLIQQEPGYQGQPIRLLSCETGACDAGFAQHLANRLGVPVQAPTELLWAYDNGTMLVARGIMRDGALLPDLSHPGTFRTFFPGNGLGP